MENTREIVLDMLLMVEREEEYSHRIIRDVLTKYDYLTVQEKAFIKRLFEGTLERKTELDYYLNTISSVPVHKMKPLIRCLLRMSAYQILYMDAVPDAAAANEAVKLAAKRKFHNLKGFVNGVLRKLASTKGELELPDEQKEPDRYLSVAYSMPDWLVAHFKKSYDYKETKQLLNGLLSVKPVTIRFSASYSVQDKEDMIKKIRESGVTVREHAYVKQAYYLENCDNITELPGFAEGAFTVQDASSMLAVAAAGIKPGDMVLDVCAAPGGKSLLAAEYTGVDGHVEARDVSEYKTAQIEENVARMGQANVSVKVWDATVSDKEAFQSADVVLVDVPCSGLGVMGKKRDIKYRQKPESLVSITELQKEILTQVSSYVKPGGILLYSTCTINPAENEEMTGWMCDELGFTPEPLTEFLPANLPQSTAEKGYLQLLPHIHDTDGFFFARLKKC